MWQGNAGVKSARTCSGDSSCLREQQPTLRTAHDKACCKAASWGVQQQQHCCRARASRRTRTSRATQRAGAGAHQAGRTPDASAARARRGCQETTACHSQQLKGRVPAGRGRQQRGQPQLRSAAPPPANRARGTRAERTGGRDGAGRRSSCCTCRNQHT